MKDHSVPSMVTGSQRAFAIRIVLFLSLLVGSILWNISPGQAQTISRDEYLATLLRAHPLPQKELLAAHIERKTQDGFSGAQDWFFSSSLGIAHEEPALSFAGPERTNSVALTAAVQRTFWETGGRATFSFSSGGARIQPTFGFSMPFYQNMVAFQYVQPLLKNSGGTLDRLEYDLKGFDADVAGIHGAENIEMFLLESARLFLSWVFLTEQERIIAERLRLSREERDRVQEKRRANLVDQADVIRAEDAVRSWQQQHVQVQSERNAIRAHLAVLAGFPRLNDMEPDFDLYGTEQLPSLQEVLTRLPRRSRPLKALDLQRRQLDLGRGGFEEALRPDLSLYGTANTKRLDERFGRSIAMDKPDFGIGVRFSVPISNRTAKANIEKTDLQIMQITKQQDQVLTLLKASLSNLSIRLEELREVLVLNAQQIESARQRTEEDLKLYNQGRGELTFVLLSRDNEQNGRIMYAHNAFTYHSLLLEYKSLMDELYESEEH